MKTQTKVTIGIIAFGVLLIIIAFAAYTAKKAPLKEGGESPVDFDKRKAEYDSPAAVTKRESHAQIKAGLLIGGFTAVGAGLGVVLGGYLAKGEKSEAFYAF